ncbi:hypothetical protein FACS1894159_10310 [Bacteroidia bacterium]|nr:hypothetical protein FACS1894159_10310 [Bacteroidia bacterium]
MRFFDRLDLLLGRLFDALDLAVKALGDGVFDGQTLARKDIVHRLVQRKEKGALVDADTLEVGYVDKSHRHGIEDAIGQLADAVVDIGGNERIGVLQRDDPRHILQRAAHVDEQLAAVVLAIYFDDLCHDQKVL